MATILLTKVFGASNPFDKLNMMADTSATQSKYKLSTRGLFAYAALWALTFGVIHFLSKYSAIGAKGSYSTFASQVTDLGLPVAVGLVLSCLGLAIAFLAGKIKHYRGVFAACFVFGILAIPLLILSLFLLAMLGVIDLD